MCVCVCILHLGLSFPRTDTINIFKDGDERYQKGMRSVCNEKRPRRAADLCSGLCPRVLFMEGREDPPIEKKQSAKQESCVGTEAGKKCLVGKAPHQKDGVFL